MNPAEEMPSRLEKRFLGLAGGEQAQIRWPPPLPRHQALRLRAAVVSGIHRRFCLRNEKYEQIPNQRQLERDQGKTKAKICAAHGRRLDVRRGQGR